MIAVWTCVQKRSLNNALVRPMAWNVSLSAQWQSAAAATEDVWVMAAVYASRVGQGCTAIIQKKKAKIRAPKMLQTRMQLIVVRICAATKDCSVTIAFSTARWRRPAATMAGAWAMGAACAFQASQESIAAMMWAPQRPYVKMGSPLVAANNSAQWLRPAATTAGAWATVAACALTLGTDTTARFVKIQLQRLQPFHCLFRSSSLTFVILTSSTDWHGLTDEMYFFQICGGVGHHAIHARGVQ
jgi:hypothetical protein